MKACTILLPICRSFLFLDCVSILLRQPYLNKRSAEEGSVKQEPEDNEMVFTAGPVIASKKIS